MKYLLIFLTSSTLLTLPVISLNKAQTKEIFNLLTIDPTYPNLFFYPNLNVSSKTGGNAWNWTYTNSDHQDFEINILNYSNDVNEFIKYYSSLTIDFTGYSASSGFSYQQNYSGPVTIDLQQNSFSHEFNKWSKKGAENQASNDASISVSWNNNILDCNFIVNTWVFKGLNSSWTDSTSNLYIKKICFNSNLNLDELEQNLSAGLNKSIEFVSDYSGSLEDKNNIIDPSQNNHDETSALTDVIKNILGQKEYENWKEYLEPFAFSDATRTATTTIKFRVGNTGEQKVWYFHTPINIVLSDNYWGKSLKDRLTILPGKIVDPNDSTKGMISDTGRQLEPWYSINDTYGGTIEYHTSADIEFDALDNSSEWMTVNDKPVQVLNNKFIYSMIDKRVDKKDTGTNLYDVVLYHDMNGNKSHYEIKYQINNLVPNLQLKWYAWDPNNNPDQKTLITPSLPNGKPNPKYDKEVNSQTGTKTQILWIKQTSQYSFPLDPLDKDGNIIRNKNNYDLGFISEGSVAGMGVQQLFKSSEVKEINREGVDNKLASFLSPNSKQRLTIIDSDTDNKYWSWEGFWHYIIKTNDQLTYQKYVLIGADYQNKYPRFLDVLNDANIAVDFWTTIHGVHLKNFLIMYKNLDSNDLQKLNFEQVASYWKEYSSDIISQRIPPDPNPSNYYNLEGSFSEIKMNKQDIKEILTTINQEVALDITKYSSNAKLAMDYNIYTTDNDKKDINVDSSTLASLLNDKITPQYLTLTINSLSTSTLLTGQAKINIRNSSHYDPDKVDDLSKIQFNNYQYNFTDFTSEQLAKWILQNVSNYLQEYKYTQIKLNLDYGVSDNGIPTDDINHNNTPGDLSNAVLKKFIMNANNSQLTIVVYANDNSDLATNSTSFILFNDASFPPAPPTPPTPPDPNPIVPGGNQTTVYLTWIFSVLISLASIGILGWYIYRVRTHKGLPGLKTNKIKSNNNASNELNGKSDNSTLLIQPKLIINKTINELKNRCLIIGQWCYKQMKNTFIQTQQIIKNINKWRKNKRK